MEVWSMTVRRTIAAIAVVGVAPLAAVALTAAPASAHGAPDDPVSRAVACGLTLKQNTGSAACKAAIAVSGNAFKDWDNVRVPNINGRDRQLIPDGKLCSGGIDRFGGLDLPRDDWPSTSLISGSAFTFRYRETVPHQGTFKFFVTKDGYDATRALTWDSLEDRPFLQVKDPPLTGDAYVMKGKLPDRAGRHMIFTIWQNTSTPDTYYSCSDVVFGAGAGAGTTPGVAGHQGVPPPPPPAAPGRITDQSAPGGSEETAPTATEPPPPGGSVDDRGEDPGRPVAVAQTAGTRARSGVATALTTGVVTALAGAGLVAVILIRRRRTGLQPASARQTSLWPDEGRDDLSWSTSATPRGHADLGPWDRHASRD